MQLRLAAIPFHWRSADGGIGFELNHSYLEFQLRASIGSIVVTKDYSPGSGCDAPPPKRFTTVALSWGWRL